MVVALACSPVLDSPEMADRVVGVAGHIVVQIDLSADSIVVDNDGNCLGQHHTQNAQRIFLELLEYTSNIDLAVGSKKNENCSVRQPFQHSKFHNLMLSGICPYELPWRLLYSKSPAAKPYG